MSRKNANNYYNNNEEYQNNEEYENDNNLGYGENNNNYNNYNDNYYQNDYNNNYYQNDYNNNYYHNNYYQNNYNNPYGNVLQYYNNYPVYATIPASGPYSNNQVQNYNEGNEQYYSKKLSTDSSSLKGKTALKNKPSGEVTSKPFKIRKEDICYLRPPGHAPGFVSVAPGKPAYANQPPKKIS